MKFKSYIPPILFLIAVVALTYFIFIYAHFVDDSEKRITGIIALLGLSLGIFQFWIREINNKKRRDFELKYEVYKEILKTIESIGQKLNIEMTNSEINLHGLVSSLMNLINEFQDIVKVNDDFIFPGLQYKESFTRMRDITVSIIIRTGEFRKKFEELQRKIEDFSESGDHKNWIELGKMVERSNWHNETVDLLRKFYFYKQDFYKDMRSYF